VADEQQRSSGDDPPTEVIPSLRSGEGIPDTRELPVVPAPAPPVTAPRATPERRRSRRPVALVALLAVAALAAVVAAVTLWPRSGPGSAATPATERPATAKLTAEVSSFDPSGGSGFRPDAPGTWRTQTYRSADFGNLKPGVGLLLDLGAPKVVSTVTLDVQGGPLAVELRAADQRGAAASDFDRVATEAAASGATSLAVEEPAKHRYWLVWVTRLAPQDGGYRAVLRDVVVTGPGG
jgi:hypothetical protein